MRPRMLLAGGEPSRIFAGVHFRFDLTTGARLGRDVADFVVDTLLRRVEDREDEREHGRGERSRHDDIVCLHGPGVTLRRVRR